MLDDTKNFCFLVEICGGILEAYKACEKYGGITLTIPKKEHKRAMIRELIKNNVSDEEILAHIAISKKSFYTIKKELLNA